MRTKAKHTLSPAEQLYVKLPADASTTEVALATVALWDEEDARKKGYSEKVADAQAAAERKKAKDEILAAILKPQSAKTHALPDVLLRCNAFDTTDKRVPREVNVEKFYPVYAGGAVLLDSKVELRQDDKRVLGALVHVCSRLAPDAKTFSIKPSALLRELGWSDSGELKASEEHKHQRKHSASSKDRLHACITRLTKSTLSYYKTDPMLPEWITVLVASAELTGAEWRIELPSSIAHMFIDRSTRLNKDVLMRISMGFPSWLADFLCSHDGNEPFTLDVLQLHGGCSAMPRFAFKRKLKRTLAHIAKAGAIANYGFGPVEQAGGTVKDGLYYAKPAKSACSKNRVYDMKPGVSPRVYDMKPPRL